MKWIIQNNLIAENDYQEMQKACDDIGVEYQNVQVIPFSDDLPEFDIDENNIYYGSTTFMYNVLNQLDNPKGLFFDPDTFCMENYIKHWGDHMLSSEGEITSFGEFSKRKLDPDSEWFIRPDADSKAFNGMVMEFGAVERWFDSVMQCDVYGIDADTKILAGPAYSIAKEWRNFIVDGEVVTSSRYREGMRLSKSSTDIPSEMLQFVRDRIKDYHLHDVYAMDVGLCGGEYYIIECGCMNSVGFYHADIHKYVKSITNYMRK